MPHKITRVRWSAQNIPWGMAFDEHTGTFSGKPDDEGTYTVPVHVETNYGEDTKDVTISVNRQISSGKVYAIGASAAIWNNGAEADNYGFYPLNVPKSYKLLPHYRGFGAKTLDEQYYCCGVYDVDNDISSLVAPRSIALSRDPSTNKSLNLLLVSDEPRLLSSESHGDVEEVSVVRLSTYDLDKASSSNYYYSRYIRDAHVILIKYSDGITIVKSTKVYYYANNNTVAAEGWLEAITEAVNGVHSFVENPNFYNYSVRNYITMNYGAPFLLKDNDKVWAVSCDVSPDATLVNPTSTWTISQRHELSSRAVKIFSVNGMSTSYGLCHNALPVFSFLSESKYLNGVAEHFTLGQIRDAWVCYYIVYVVTADNKLYRGKALLAKNQSDLSEYTYDSVNVTWTEEGIFDVKKMEINRFSDYTVFMLTNEGGLYHKGDAITDITEQHNEFTQIFPECYFHDFTFDPETKTLTVLKE